MDSDRPSIDGFDVRVAKLARDPRSTTKKMNVIGMILMGNAEPGGMSSRLYTAASHRTISA